MRSDILIVYNLEEKIEAFEYTKNVADRVEIFCEHYIYCTNDIYYIDYMNGDKWICLPGYNVSKIKGRRADIIYYSARLPQDVIDELYHCRKGLKIMIPVDFQIEKELNKR